MRSLQVLIIIFCFGIICPNVSFAKDEVVFLYLNGSMTNSEQKKKWFYHSTNKFHSLLKKTLEEDPFIVKKMLWGYKISYDPLHVYWGQMSKEAMERLERKMVFGDFKKPIVAQIVRRSLTSYIHDALWISKFPHLIPVLDMTHQKIMEESEKGNKVVLFGYSAGSFITYQYFANKLPIISNADLAAIGENKNNKEYKKIVFKVKPQPTCIDAIFRGKIMAYDMLRDILLEPGVENFKKSIIKLDEYTKMYCAPKDTVIGAINYGSPLMLFFSELGHPIGPALEEINTLMYKYIVENNLFMLTVNYTDDPFGFPMGEYTNLEKIKTQMGSRRGEGVFYDVSDTSSRRTFLFAHNSYWNKRFAKNILRAYKKGYEHFMP